MTDSTYFRTLFISALILFALAACDRQAAEEPAEPATELETAQQDPATDAAAAQQSESTDEDGADGDDPASRHMYYSHGVHNNVGCEPPESCVYQRGPDEPTDPLFPKWWSSEWTMYRVFNKYKEFPPPYTSPPQGLTPADYQVSYGATYYDSTYVPADRDGYGAMMEHYQEYCLPIFPMDNHFSCAFVSLGNKAYFLRYDDRPPGTPACCKFSPVNHPPRRDFIKHLPYSKQDSTHVDGTIQAYSLWVDAGPQKILFGYSFNKEATPDSYDPEAEPYRHPQSFYFSGSPTVPPDAPMVSQNYRNFRMQQPDPAQTWDQVAAMCPADPEWCCLFPTDCPNKSADQLAGDDWANLQPVDQGGEP